MLCLVINQTADPPWSPGDRLRGDELHLSRSCIFRILKSKSAIPSLLILERGSSLPQSIFQAKIYQMGVPKSKVPNGIPIQKMFMKIYNPNTLTPISFKFSNDFPIELLFSSFWSILTEVTPVMVLLFILCMLSKLAETVNILTCCLLDWQRNNNYTEWNHCRTIP